MAVVVTGKYHPAPWPYNYLYMAMNNPAVLAADFVLSDTFRTGTSAFFWVNSLLRVEANELVTLALYAFVCAVGLGLTYLILRRHCNLPPTTAIAVLSLLILVDRKILASAWAVIIPVHPGSPSALGNALAILSIFLALERRFLWSALSLCVLYAVAPKENILLMPAFALMAVLLGQWRQGMWVFLPFAYLAAQAATALGYQSSSHEDMLALMRFLRLTENHDGFFSDHPVAANMLFVAAMLGTPFLSRTLRPELRSLVWATVLPILALWVINLVYTETTFWQRFPKPQFIFIGAVRCAKFAIFLFFVAATIAILRSERLRWHEKASLLVALFLVHGESIRGVVYPAVILALAFAPRLFRRPGSSPFAAHASGPLANGSAAVTASSFVIAWQILGGGTYSLPTVDPAAYQITGRFGWEGNIPSDAWRAADAVRRQHPPGEFVMVPLYRASIGTLEIGPEIAVHARQALYDTWMFAGFTTKPSEERFAEVRFRIESVQLVRASMESGNALSVATLAALAARNVRIFMPEELADLAGRMEIERLAGGYVLARPKWNE